MFNSHTWKALKLAAIPLMVALGACDGGMVAPEPEPQFEGRWDIDVTVRYVRASSEATCDGETIFKRNNPGEYQYRVYAALGDVEKSFETNNYGKVTGRSHELDTGEMHNFTNRTWKFSDLAAEDFVRLEMFVTEWDGPSKDDYMDHLSWPTFLVPSELLPVGGRLTDQSFQVGKDTCGLKLIYDVRVAHRELPIE